jgi:hypothetical protein
MTCPACTGYVTACVGLDASSPSGISVTYVCWHGLEVTPPEWSVQAILQAETRDVPRA